MPPKKNDGNKDEKNKQVPSPSASNQGSRLANELPQHAAQWVISEMEKKEDQVHDRRTFK